jgi:glycolate oxidase FAD binding subunit
MNEFTDRIQAATAQKIPLAIQGGGSKKWYGQTPQGDVLETRNYAGLIDYDPSELVVTARCGTLLSDLQDALADRQQMFAFEPPSFGSDATIGGVVAAGLSGPRRASAGGLRDFVLGAVLLNGRGERLVFGGQVMKNVAGYDVSRLLAGSMGCLGLILEVSLKVLPKPKSEISLSFDMTQQTALRTLAGWAGKPIPVSASAWEDQKLTIRLSGSEAATTAAKIQTGGELLVEADAHQYWRDLREQVHPFFQHQTVWRLSLPSTTPMLDWGGNQIIEWGGAQRWLTDTTQTEEQIRHKARAVGGHATLFKGGDKSTGVFQPLPTPVMAIHRRLKAEFDPAGIFNPGRLYPDL